MAKQSILTLLFLGAFITPSLAQTTLSEEQRYEELQEDLSEIKDKLEEIERESPYLRTYKDDEANLDNPNVYNERLDLKETGEEKSLKGPVQIDQIDDEY